MRLLIFGGDASGSIQQLQNGHLSNVLQAIVREDGIFNMMQTKKKMRVTQVESVYWATSVKQASIKSLICHNIVYQVKQFQWAKMSTTYGIQLSNFIVHLD